jgi:hypothetical protein
MSDGEQVLRLLSELQRHDRETTLQGTSSPTITPAALLEALLSRDFDLTAAIIEVAHGA